jgi:hypothetical protein
VVIWTIACDYFAQWPHFGGNKMQKIMPEVHIINDNCILLIHYPFGVGSMLFGESCILDRMACNYFAQWPRFGGNKM